MSAPVTYLIRDTAGNNYGPAEAAVILQWIGERRITSEMMVSAAEEQAFVQVSAHPLFSGAFVGQMPISSPVVERQVSGPRNPPTCGYAIAAFFLALAGLFICPVIPAGIAFIYGMKSLRRQEKANGSGQIVLGGRRLAQISIAVALVGMFGGVIFVAMIVKASLS